MARVNKNGNLSGAIGNLVFVNRDGKTHVRSKSKKVNQSTTIRGAATGFGKNSGHDRILREAITDKIQIRNYRCFSINHRTRLRLTIGESTNQDCTTKMATSIRSQWSARYSITIGSGRELRIFIPSIT